MKIETTFMPNRKLRVQTLSDEFDFDTLFQAIVDVYNHPQFDPSFNSIWDFSKVENIQRISLDQLEKIVAYVVWKRSKYNKVRTAIVVSSDIDFGLAKLYEREVEAANQADISIFHNLNDALIWLK
jgi:hypothetical protein